MISKCADRSGGGDKIRLGGAASWYSHKDKQKANCCQEDFHSQQSNITAKQECARFCY